MVCMLSWGGAGCYWKHLGKGALSSPGHQRNPPREKRSRNSSGEGGAGVCVRRGIPAQSAARAKRRGRVQYVLGAVSSSTQLKSEAGVGGGLVEVPVEAERQERPDLKDSML